MSSTWFTYPVKVTLTVKLIAKDSWDWISTAWDNVDLKEDFGCPERILALKKARDGEDFDKPCLTRGSADNDAALYVPAESIDDEIAHFWSLQESLEFISTHNIKIIDTYEGCIY